MREVFTDRLDEREPSELLDELRRFARRRPGAFLLGAFAAGAVAGRVARGAKDADSGEPAGAGGSDLSARGEAPVEPRYTTRDQPIGATGVATGPAARSPGIPPEPGSIRARNRRARGLALRLRLAIT